MTNRDRLIEALRGTAPDAVYRNVLVKQISCPYLYDYQYSMTKEDEGLCDKDFEAWERNPTATCFACIEDWLSEESDFEMEGLKNEWGNN